MLVRVLALVIAVALAPSPAAAAAQMSPRDKPATAGPLNSSDDSYTGKPCVRDEVTKRGKVVASIVRCWSFYRFEPGAETDDDRDYGVWWIQSSQRAEEGWCLRQASASLGMPFDFEATASVGKTKTLKKERRVPVKLIAPAGGHAPFPGEVRNSFTVFPGSLNAAWSPETHTFEISWQGGTKNKVALAGGIEGYWPTGGGPPIFLPGATARATRNCPRSDPEQTEKLRMSARGIRMSARRIFSADSEPEAGQFCAR